MDEACEWGFVRAGLEFGGTVVLFRSVLLQSVEHKFVTIAEHVELK